MQCWCEGCAYSVFDNVCVVWIMFVQFVLVVVMMCLCCCCVVVLCELCMCVFQVLLYHVVCHVVVSDCVRCQ